jgi:hypothetical protein
LCPLVLGGQSAPTLADGLEAAKLSQAIPLEMKSRRRVGDELFLVYKVRGASKRSAAKTRAPLDKIEPSGRSA